MKERTLIKVVVVLLTVAVSVVLLGTRSDARWAGQQGKKEKPGETDRQPEAHAQRMLAEGKHTFRFDTFGDEAFWSDALQLHRAIAGANLGGVGPGVFRLQSVAVDQICDGSDQRQFH